MMVQVHPQRVILFLLVNKINNEILLQWGDTPYSSKGIQTITIPISYTTWNRVYLTGWISSDTFTSSSSCNIGHISYMALCSTDLSYFTCQRANYHTWLSIGV